jgi:hypothetical protein
MNERTTTNRRERRERMTGEGGSGWSPYVASSTHDREESAWWRKREIDMIEKALEDHGEMRRGELGDAVACKYWGPGRFRGALNDAVEQGRIERTGFGRYAPAHRERRTHKERLLQPGGEPGERERAGRRQVDGGLDPCIGGGRDPAAAGERSSDSYRRRRRRCSARCSSPRSPQLPSRQPHSPTGLPDRVCSRAGPASSLPPEASAT